MMKVTNFFGANRQYVVVGASNNAHKFGYIVTKWYVDRGLAVTPVNPIASTILDCEVLSSISRVMSDLETVGSEKDGLSISFLTPPAISENIIREIAKLPNYKDVIKGLWFQPGSYEEQVLAAAEESGLGDKVIADGKCILVIGDQAMHDIKL